MTLLILLLLLLRLWREVPGSDMSDPRHACLAIEGTHADSCSRRRCRCGGFRSRNSRGCCRDRCSTCRSRTSRNDLSRIINNSHGGKVCLDSEHRVECISLGTRLGGGSVGSCSSRGACILRSLVSSTRVRQSVAYELSDNPDVICRAMVIRRCDEQLP